MNLPDAPPWSKKKLRATGDAVRDGTPTPVGAPTLPEALAWYEGLASFVHARIEQAVWPDWLVDEVTVSHRTKSLDTIREKLNREQGSNLPTMRDVAGVRMVGNFPPYIQSKIPDGLATMLPEFTFRVVDRRAEPKSGYRALHVEASLHTYSCEIQIRTKLQAAWANTFESLADAWGRQIRYGGDPDGYGDVFEFRCKAISSLQSLSTTNIANVEALQDRVFNARAKAGMIPELELQLPQAGPISKIRRARQRRQIKQIARQVDQLAGEDLDFLDFYESILREDES